MTARTQELAAGQLAKGRYPCVSPTPRPLGIPTLMTGARSRCDPLAVRSARGSRSAKPPCPGQAVTCTESPRPGTHQPGRDRRPRAASRAAPTPGSQP